MGSNRTAPKGFATIRIASLGISGRRAIRCPSKDVTVGPANAINNGRKRRHSAGVLARAYQNILPSSATAGSKAPGNSVIEHVRLNCPGSTNAGNVDHRAASEKEAKSTENT